MKKKDIDIFDCLYEIPSHEGGSPRIMFVKHNDGGTARVFHMDITGDELDERGLHENHTSYSSLHDCKIDADYFFKLQKAWRKYQEVYRVETLKLGDHLYDLYRHKSCKEDRWEGEVNVGDTVQYICGGMGIAKITAEVDSYWLKYIKGEDEDKTPPFEAIRLEENICYQRLCLYKSFIHRPIPHEIYDAVEAAYNDYLKVFRDTIAEIRERYDIPEWIDKYKNTPKKRESVNKQRRNKI